MCGMMADLPPKRERKPRTSVPSKSVYIEDQWWDRLQEIAAAEGYRSRNELVAGVLRQFVQDYDTKKPPPDVPPTNRP